MQQTICRICGEEERNHHEFTQMPEHCQCASHAWLDKSNIPNVCINFDPDEEELCKGCGHLMDCHDY